MFSLNLEEWFWKRPKNFGSSSYTFSHSSSYKPEKDLFSDGLPAEIRRSVTLEGLAEQGIERASNAVDGVGITGHGESGDVGETQTAVIVTERCGSVQTVCVLEVLCQTLQERQRLTERHLGHSYIVVVILAQSWPTSPYYHSRGRWKWPTWKCKTCFKRLKKLSRIRFSFASL